MHHVRPDVTARDAVAAVTTFPGAVAWHVEDRVLVHGNTTIVFA